MSGGDNGKKKKRRRIGARIVTKVRSGVSLPVGISDDTHNWNRMSSSSRTSRRDGFPVTRPLSRMWKKRRRNAHSNQLIPKICHRLMTPTRSGRRKEINTRGHSLWKKNFFLVGIEPGGKEKKKKRDDTRRQKNTKIEGMPRTPPEKKGQQSLSSLQFLTLCGEGVGGVYMAGTAGCIQRRVPNSMKHAKSNQFNWRFYLSALPDFSPSLSLSPPRAPGKRIDRAACRRRAKKLYNVLRASISYKDGGIERSDSFVGDQSQ